MLNVGVRDLFNAGVGIDCHVQAGFPQNVKNGVWRNPQNDPFIHITRLLLFMTLTINHLRVLSDFIFLWISLERLTF